MDRHRRIAGSASALLGLTQFALGAVTAPLVGLGDGTAGTALAITALVATLVGVLALLLGRTEILAVVPDAPERLAPRSG
jgi:DHA1 family bicyclomycin/chloramphenicol resistance-like MFS transporter